MAASGQIRAGRAFVEISGDATKLNAALRRAGNSLKAFGGSIRTIGAGVAGIGVGVLGSLGAASMIFANMGDELAKSSQRTGVAVEALSSLKYAAEQSGAGLEDLETGLRGMSRFLLEAQQNTGAANETLAQLHLTFQQLSGLSPDEQFKLIGDAVNKIQDPTLRAAMAMKVFGKSGTALLPMLADGAAGIEALQRRSDELGLTMSGADAAAAVKFGDILEDLWKQAKMVTFHVGAAVAQALQPWLEKAAIAGASVVAWVRNNRGLVLTVTAVAAGLISAGAGLVTFGVAISGVGIAMKGLSSTLGAIGSAISFIASPLGIVTTLLIGGGAAWAYFTESGRAAMSALKKVSVETFKGIADALSAGDIQLAAEILWTGLKLAWVAGTASLRKIWIELQNFLTTTMIKVLSTLVTTALTIVQAMMGGIIGVVQGMLANINAAWHAAFSGPSPFDNLIAGLQGAFGQLDAQIDQIKKQINAIEPLLIDAANKNAAQDVAVLEKQKAELQARLDELRKQAAKEAGKPSGAPPTPPGAPAAAADGLDLAQRGVAARTTFNAAAIQSLQGGRVNERIAKATERTAMNTQRTYDAVKDANGIFA
jgi:hypothetical protein